MQIFHFGNFGGGQDAAFRQVFGTEIFPAHSTVVKRRHICEVLKVATCRGQGEFASSSYDAGRMFLSKVQLNGVCVGSMSRWPHLGSCPEHFEDFADIFMVVGSQRVPAHSQYLAGHSKLMQNLMRDSPPFSKDTPLVLDQQLQGFTASELQSFLNQIYLSPVISSSADAYALLRLADLFDAAKLMGKAVAYLEETAAEDLFASGDATLKWLLLAERLNLESFMKHCAKVAAIQYRQIRQDQRFSQLGQAALTAVMDSLHMLTDVYPALWSKSPAPASRDLDVLDTCTFNHDPAEYVTLRSDHIAASQLHVQQSYMCKACVLGANRGQGFAICPGHQGSWDWNLQ